MEFAPKKSSSRDLHSTDDTGRSAEDWNGKKMGLYPWGIFRWISCLITVYVLCFCRFLKPTREFSGFAKTGRPSADSTGCSICSSSTFHPSAFHPLTTRTTTRITTG
ncbi:hypothetical protein RvY_17651 [Ramazzottius varieornatus]|uniref:Uncharacterized protein n=1 Tax=Ramazzottius varieornatus TaxID=947166 RepID=A0A1D1W9S1_RAMVA|nr:hypothetical protein RvY_17651 [Ramazzottius varieornatus]